MKDKDQPIDTDLADLLLTKADRELFCLLIKSSSKKLQKELEENNGE